MELRGDLANIVLIFSILIPMAIWYPAFFLAMPKLVFGVESLNWKMAGRGTALLLLGSLAAVGIGFALFEAAMLLGGEIDVDVIEFGSYESPNP